MTFGGNAKFVAILITLLTISTYVALHIRKYKNIPLPIPDDEMVQKKHNTTVIINPNPNTTVISNNYNNSETYSNNNVITKTFNPDVYLFSAFKVIFEEYQYPFDKNKYRVNNKHPTDVIWLNGWQRQSAKGSLFKCCFLLKNNTVVEIQSNRANTQYPSAIRAIQYVCPIVVENNLIKLASVVLGNKKCPAHSKYYVKLNIGPTERNPNLAICTKLTYDSVDPIPIVEWFETQRILGVDKVATYPYRLNARALKVLKYYESVGFLDIIYGFYLPEEDRIKRYQGQQVVQAWNDQQVIVYDCMSRLWTYRYVGVFDKDEFIVPKLRHPIQGALKSLLEEVFQKKELAGITLDTKLHFTTWEPTVEKPNLDIERFANSTHHLHDRVKHIHFPQRVIPGSVRTHVYHPFSGFKRVHKAGYKVIRYPITIARYKMIQHRKEKPSRNRLRMLKNGSKRFKTDGINSLKYRVNKIECNPLFTRLLVDINEKEVMTAN